MKVISAYDLKEADPLKGMNQFDLVHPDNMDKVNSVLATIGFDINKPIHVYAAQHRTMSNKVVVGYVFAGEHNFAREHVKGPYSTIHDVLGAAEAQDRSLFEELYAMNYRCHDYGAETALDDKIPVREDDEYKEEEERLTKEIKQLEEILFNIRGDQFKADGSVKTAWDYKNPVPEQKRMRRKKKQKQQAEEGNT